ncbi:MAG: hypothetical protein Q7S16_00920, partial [bacterium]|nr:hypothetical protein [bacterium]
MEILLGVTIRRVVRLLAPKPEGRRHLSGREADIEFKREAQRVLALSPSFSPRFFAQFLRRG